MGGRGGKYPAVIMSQLAARQFDEYATQQPGIEDAGGLGVHVTLDMAGRARFGPDVRWIEHLDYAFDDSRKGDFATAIRHYYPNLNIDDLEPSYTGIRPKIGSADQPNLDFRIDGPEVHGRHGLINLFGIESPGLTASLAIAEAVSALTRGSGAEIH